MADNIKTDAEVIRDHVAAAMTPTSVDVPGDLPVNLIAVPSGYDLRDLDQYAPRPRQRKLTITCQSLASFVEYVQAHAAEDTEVLGSISYKDFQHADPDGGLICVIDGSRWRKHIVRWTPVEPPDMRTWKALSGVWHNSLDLQRDLRQLAATIAAPNLTDLIAIIESARADTSVSRTWNENEQVHAANRNEKTTFRGGPLPMIEVVMEPWRYAPARAFKARLDMKVEDSKVKWRIVLVDLENVIDTAFADAVGQVKAETNVPVYL